MVGKEEVIVKSTKDFAEKSNIYLTLIPDSMHIMKKQLSTNVFTDIQIDKITMPLLMMFPSKSTSLNY